MKLEFLGAVHEVTGSCTLLTACGKNIIIDCGMEQGGDTYENCELPISPGKIDCVLLTHAHIDHSGRIPVLTSNGYAGPIYATGATVKLCGIMLLDSAHIQESEALWRNRKAKRAGEESYKPAYTTQDVQSMLHQFESCDYEKDYKLFDGIRVRFFDAGHLLGSSSIEITVCEDGSEKVLVFSGDIGNVDRPLIKNPTKPEKADFVVVESTYGNRLHGERKDYVSQLTEVIGSTLDKGGNIVIPSFAVGRTQELLYLIREIKERNLLPHHKNFEVWVDSPLAVEATQIYGGKQLDMMEYYDSETLEQIKRGKDVLKFPGLNLSVTSDDSKRLNSDRTPKVIISASGMCEAGRIRHHLKHNLWRPESTILFVGYQAEGSVGRIITDGAKIVKLFGEEIKVNARIAQMDGISGHADRSMLLGWLGNIKTKPQTVFVNHGADTVCDEFAETVTQTLHIKAVAPYNGAVYDLTADSFVSIGNTVRIDKKKSPGKPAASSAFERLLSAGRRLMGLIERSRGVANKDLAKLTSQINEICNKWER